MAKQGTFDMGAFIADQGLELVGVGVDGNYRVKDADGNEGVFDVDAALKDQGFSRNQVELQFNDPSKAVDGTALSGVGLVDRAKLALGNTRGQIGYLKKKFEDATFSEENGLVVKHKGVWHKVDKDGMDPWELTKDIVEGAISFVPSAVASGVGAAKAAVAAAPAGPLAAAAAGVVGAATGGGAAEGVRTSLGRLVNTYDATPEEQLKDIGLEALLNAGGQTVAAGAKPAFSMLAKAGKAIAETADPAVKELFAAVVGTTTGAGQNAARILWQDPDGVAMASKKALQAAGDDALQAVNILKAEQVAEAKRLAEMARPRLRQVAQKLDDDLMDAIPDNFEGDVSELVRGMLRKMEEAGLGAFDDVKKAVSGLAERKARTPDPKDFKFRLRSFEEIEELIAQRKVNMQGITREALDTMGKFVEQANMYARRPSVSGKAAAKDALDVRRALNNVFFTLKDSADGTTMASISQFSADLDNQLVELFTKSGSKLGAERGKLIGDRFNAMRDTYKRYADVVSEAERFAAEKNGSEVFLNKIVSVPGSQATAKGDLDLLVELTGEEGKRLASSIARKEGAKGFTRIWPNPSKLTAALAGGAAVYGAQSGDLDGATVAGATAIASPRLAMKQVMYGKKFLGFLQSLTPKARAEWLRSPQLVDATLREVTKGLADEAGIREQLLGEAQKAVGGQ
jgi:hypothetical protein